MPTSYLTDILSVVDHTIYSIKTIPTPTNQDIVFFDETEASVGKHKSNLTLANQLSKNWKKFDVYGIGIKFFDLVSAESLVQFFRDSFYSFKISDTELKWGHLSEFFNSNAFVYYEQTSTEGTLSTRIQDLYSSGKGSGFYHGFISGLELSITSGVHFVFTISCKSSIAELQGKSIGVFLKGKLERYITG